MSCPAYTHARRGAVRGHRERRPYYDGGMERRAYVGARVRKLRGDRFLTGRGRYLDDIELAGTAHLAILRSSHAHARIAVDASAAAAHPDALLVLTGETVAAISDPIPRPARPGGLRGQPGRGASARARARSSTTASRSPPSSPRGAATPRRCSTLIEVALRRRCPSSSTRTPRSPTTRRGSTTAGPTTSSPRSPTREGDVDGALAAAPHRLADELRIQRYSTQPLEARGYLADWNAATSG